MTIEKGASPSVEAALRWLATRKDGVPLRFLRDAIEKPASEAAAELCALVTTAASLPEATVESRACAVWGLLFDEINAAADSRRHSTLAAAFRVPPAPGGTAWKGTLSDRFKQLLQLPGVFGDPLPTTTAPMHQAWRRALEDLTGRLEAKLASLEGADWQPYIDIGRAAVEVVTGRVAWRARAASRGAQPVFVERMLVTAIMHRRTVHRRITERDIAACEDGVDGYDAHALIGWTHDAADIPVRALWACRVRPG